MNVMESQAALDDEEREEAIEQARVEADYRIAGWRDDQIGAVDPDAAARQ